MLKQSRAFDQGGSLARSQADDVVIPNKGLVVTSLFSQEIGENNPDGGVSRGQTGGSLQQGFGLDQFAAQALALLIRRNRNWP
jgi:hypothetical protein